MTATRQRAIHVVLTSLVLFDTTLVIWAFAFPQAWLAAFHTAGGGGPLAELLLARCGANWAAFLLLQAIAWARWRTAPVWLAVVAGVRLSDIFTDPTYAVLSADPTWFSWASLPLMGLVNLAVGIFLLQSYRAIVPDSLGRAPARVH